MKKITLLIILSVLLGACSAGGSVRFSEENSASSHKVV